MFFLFFFFFSSRRRHTRLQGDWSSDVCSSDLSAGRDGSPGGGPAASNAEASVLCSSAAAGGDAPRPDQILFRNACAETPDPFLPPCDRCSTLLLSLASLGRWASKAWYTRKASC